MASKKKEITSVWEYIDWLYLSNRLTAEEHLTLKQHVLNLEERLELTIENEGC